MGIWQANIIIEEGTCPDHSEETDMNFNPIVRMFFILISLAASMLLKPKALEKSPHKKETRCRE